MNTCTCYKCNEYYIDDKKHLINIGEKYYCMICCQNRPNFFIMIFIKLCINNDIDMVNKIINYGIDINTINNRGITLFAYACYYSEEIAKILINKGVSLDTEVHKGKRPIHYCEKNSEVYNMLIDAGCKP